MINPVTMNYKIQNSISNAPHCQIAMISYITGTGTFCTHGSNTELLLYSQTACVINDNIIVHTALNRLMTKDCAYKRYHVNNQSVKQSY